MKPCLVGLVGAIMTAMSTGAVANPPSYSSVYTDIDLSQCTVMAIDELGLEWACPGHKGYPLWIAEGDLRFFVSYGFGASDEVAARQTFPGFNTIGERLEWLLDDHAEHGDFPKGTILRFFIDAHDHDAPPHQVLVVTRIAPGNTCQVAHIDALANSDANQMARDAAHDLIETFDCARDSVEIVGAWGLD